MCPVTVTVHLVSLGCLSDLCVICVSCMFGDFSVVKLCVICVSSVLGDSSVYLS